MLLNRLLLLFFHRLNGTHALLLLCFVFFSVFGFIFWYKRSTLIHFFLLLNTTKREKKLIEWKLHHDDNMNYWILEYYSYKCVLHLHTCQFAHAKTIIGSKCLLWMMLIVNKSNSSKDANNKKKCQSDISLQCDMILLLFAADMKTRRNSNKLLIFFFHSFSLLACIYL